jgi:hypothetical protein
MYQVDYALLLRDTDGSVEVRHDRHVEGLFTRETWLALLSDVGFAASSTVGPDGRVIFVGCRPQERG